MMEVWNRAMKDKKNRTINKRFWALTGANVTACSGIRFTCSSKNLTLSDQFYLGIQKKRWTVNVYVLVENSWKGGNRSQLPSPTGQGHLHCSYENSHSSSWDCCKKAQSDLHWLENSAMQICSQERNSCWQGRRQFRSFWLHITSGNLPSLEHDS